MLSSGPTSQAHANPRVYQKSPKSSSLFVSERRLTKFRHAKSLCFGADPLGLRDTSCLLEPACLRGTPPWIILRIDPLIPPTIDTVPLDPRARWSGWRRRPPRAILMGFGLVVLLYSSAVFFLVAYMGDIGVRCMFGR